MTFIQGGLFYHSINSGGKDNLTDYLIYVNLFFDIVETFGL